ncbi:MAG: Kelch repeat-containing protein [Rhodothermales bacterium]
MIFLLGGLLLPGCERPFVEVNIPSITIEEPDLSVVLIEASTVISVSASSFRSIKQVILNGDPMAFDPATGWWTHTVDLQRGLNPLIFEALDIDDVVGTDTAYAMHLPFRFASNGPRLPEPRGGHTASLIGGQGVLVTGGVSSRDGPAHGDAFLLRPGATVYDRLPSLHDPRVGHTATLLADGRVLILGGSRSGTITSVADMVESVEIYDPEDNQFERVPFEGQPIRRAYHTALLRSSGANPRIDLYGGRGDIRYTPEPRLGTRSDLRSFILRNDSLIALNTQASAPFLDIAIAGHTQTRIQPGVYLLLGSFFNGQAAENVSFRIDYTSPPNIFITEAPPLTIPRTRHADATLGNGLLAFFGGHQAQPGQVLNTSELYSDAANQFFTLPAPERSIRRQGHTATNLSAQRILLIGGFGSDGNSLTLSEFFDASLRN